jgi:hypothetical protein
MLKSVYLFLGSGDVHLWINLRRGFNKFCLPVQNIIFWNYFKNIINKIKLEHLRQTINIVNQGKQLTCVVIKNVV